ncbi:bifunctional diguanylate cyclase/phosphodiesterase [Pulveribacter suum]|uniref:Bifunctional diguanylate cyclase/phosphodiesterase n=1 Tax=Pulveribacter suum TaxID=2116657 RepID=A0A2P1NLJ6_9BURK|nr:EAL domain-containing protein [Pulveribacter suum]AVP57856.1 bifunctional diguanylate cyclase/phosphodiesterase [Pulveribacter suum]
MHLPAPDDPAASLSASRGYAGLAAGALLTAVLLAFVWLFWSAQEQARSGRRQQLFDTAVHQSLAALQDRFAAFETVLRGVRGYHDGSQSISPAEFQSYYEGLALPASLPGLEMLVLLPWAGGAAAAAAGPATTLLVQPEDGQDGLAPGLLHSAASREALERSRDSGQLVLSGPLPVPGQPARVMMALALYAPAQVAATPVQRREHLQGWALARLDLARVVSDLQPGVPQDMALAIHDGPAVAGGAPLYASQPGYSPARVNADLEAVVALDLGGRRWTLVLYPLPAFEQRFEGAGHHAIALLGLAFSLLAGWFLAVQIDGRRRAMALAHTMTRELRQARDALEDTLNAVPDLLMELDQDGRFLHLRSARSDLAFMPPQAQIGHTLAEVLPARAATQFMAALEDARTAGYSEGRQYCLTMQGRERWFELSVARKGAASASTHFIALARDVSRRHDAEAAMHRLAHYDTLTGLPNRRLLLEHMQGALQACRARGTYGVLLYVDLDHFKQINDARGHGVGDSLLLQTGQRLLALAGGQDTVARLGGDEFVWLAPSLAGGPDQARAQAQALARRLIQALGQPYEAEGLRYSVNASVGAALFPTSGQSVVDLLREADTAMYRAKEQGRAQVCFFEPGMHDQAQERLSLAQDLQSAVAGSALQIYAQPQVDGTGQLVGAELLLRWHDERRGAVPPERFIAAAEESGLISRMGSQVLHQACATLALLARRGRQLGVSVNVSPRQFRQADFVQQVRAALQGSGAPAQQLTLEVTEGLLLENWQATAERMHELVALGVRLSIDDFGTGYSSLAYLKKLPLYELKIDRSFVQDVPQDDNDAAIVRAIVAVAHHLRLHVVAEGVETQAQADFLRQHGCDALQGYLYARPLPLAQWLQSLESGPG